MGEKSSGEVRGGIGGRGLGSALDENTSYTCMKSLNNKTLIFKKDNPFQECSKAHIPDDSETDGLIVDYHSGV